MKLSRKEYELAENYARMDKSDPFTFNRILSHIKNGVVGLAPNPSNTCEMRFSSESGVPDKFPRNPNAAYQARARKGGEHRWYILNGVRVDYVVPVFTDACRP